MFFYQDFPSGRSDTARTVERRLLDQALDLQAERLRLEARLDQAMINAADQHPPHTESPTSPTDGKLVT